MSGAPPASPVRNRRDTSSRDALLQRVSSEFYDTPTLRLTAAQVQRLFGLRPDVCQRVLAGLVREGTLTCGSDDRYTLNDSCRWPLQPGRSVTVPRYRSEAS
jgi:hypothetical protein